MKKLCLALLCFCSVSFALNEYYPLTRSLRAMGMGGAFYALSDDEHALFYNPAGLSLYTQDWQFVVPVQAALGTNAISNFTTLKNTFENADDIPTVVQNLEPLRGKPFSAGAGVLPFYVQKNFAVGLLLADTKVNFTLAGAGVDTEVRLAGLIDSGLFIGYAREVYPNLHVGATVKGIVRAGGKKTYTTLEIAQSDEFELDFEQLGGYGGGFDVDLGAIYEMTEGLFPFALGHRFSFTLSNLLATTFPIARSGIPPQLPRYASLGFMTTFKKLGPFGNLRLLVDFAEWSLGGQTDPELGARTGSFWKHVNWGIELPFGRNFAIRTGFHQGNFTAGLGLNGKYLKLDLAYFGMERGKSLTTTTEHRVALRVAIGLGSMYPPAILESSMAEHYKNKMDIYEAEKVVDTDPAQMGQDATGAATDLGKKLEEGIPNAPMQPPAEAPSAPAETPAADEAPLDLTSPD